VRTHVDTINNSNLTQRAPQQELEPFPPALNRMIGVDKSATSVVTHVKGKGESCAKHVLELVKRRINIVERMAFDPHWSAIAFVLLISLVNLVRFFFSTRSYLIENYKFT
jgi:hypothetical protein